MNVFDWNISNKVWEMIHFAEILVTAIAAIYVLWYKEMFLGNNSI